MKKTRRIKISITTRERIVVPADAPSWFDGPGMQICPLCRTRVAEAVSSALETVGRADDLSDLVVEMDDGEITRRPNPIIDIQIKEQ